MARLAPGSSALAETCAGWHDLDEGRIDVRSVHFGQIKRGLARVEALTPGGVEVTLWGRRYHVEGGVGLVPISRLRAALHPFRLGASWVAWEVARATPPARRPQGPRPRLLWHWLRAERGPLPALAALGGRLDGPVRRRLIARLRWALWRRKLLPLGSGYLDWGRLIDGCTATLRFTYRGTPRVLRLDQVWQHANGNYHLNGALLPSGEARIFVLDRVQAMQIDGFGPVDVIQLYTELEALQAPLPGWVDTYNRLGADLGWPRAPDPPGWRRWLSRRLADARARRRAATEAARKRAAARATERAAQAAERATWFERDAQRRDRALSLRLMRISNWEDATETLRIIADRIDSGRRVQITMLMRAADLSRDPEWTLPLIHALLGQAAAARGAAGEADDLIRAALRLHPGAVTDPDQPGDLAARAEAIQPGTRRLRTRRARRGHDRELLLAECWLRLLEADTDDRNRWQLEALALDFLEFYVSDGPPTAFRITPASAERLRAMADLAAALLKRQHLGGAGGA